MDSKTADTHPHIMLTGLFRRPLIHIGSDTVFANGAETKSADLHSHDA
jgi:hypothetical protein